MRIDLNSRSLIFACNTRWRRQSSEVELTFPGRHRNTLLQPRLGTLRAPKTPVSIDNHGPNDQNARLSDESPQRIPEEAFVANSKQSAKRARQGEKRRQHNVALRSRMRTAIKAVLNAAAAGDAEKAQALYKKAVPHIDTMVNKGLVHKNKAARTKSRLNNRVRALSS